MKQQTGCAAEFNSAAEQPVSFSRKNSASRMLLGEPDQAAGNLVMLGAALFAMIWAVARAQVQAVTGDEALTYSFWVLRPDLSHWFPSFNNHVLNSMLMRLTTSVFGVSQLSVRAPALAGAAIYITVSLVLSRLVSSQWYVRLPLFFCLVYNPFVFDFMVAARGYGMAMAFLLCAATGPVRCITNPAETSSKRILRTCALSSGFLALSFAAMFSFAFAIAASGLALLVWALRSAPKRGLRLLAACTLPGLIVIVLLPGYTLLHWAASEPYIGATSIARTIETIAQASMYRLNPNILNPLLLPVFLTLKRFLIQGLVALVLLHVLLAFRSRDKLSPLNRRLLMLGVSMASIAILSLVFHLAAFFFFGLPLPENRFAIFLIPFCTLAAGMVAAVCVPSRTGRACRAALLGGLSILALYYIGCMRLTYFREWQYQEDVKRVYEVVAWYNHARGVRDVEVNWAYEGALNFYREMSGRESLLPLTNHFAQDKNKQLYVLSGDEDRDFIAANHLKVVYRGRATDVVVAVRPELAPAVEAPSSLAILP
jgi:hypothetical protein